MVFIGSFNFDPRSANLNSEVGLVVKSDRLQNDISAALNQYLPQIAYELKLDENGEIIWLEHQKNGKTKTYTHEPETTRFQRFSIKAVSYLPIEWMM
jgi:Phosphatidylserine/phosphatidylglycerophosphate/cardiolipin synthases and related enzymes